MSRIGDTLYFAPGIPFSAVDLRKGSLPKQFFRRIDGFYLQPAIELADHQHVFASGLLAVCAVDALGWFITGASGPMERIVGLLQKIPTLDRQDMAEMFCAHFRNGLVHESRVKEEASFPSKAGPRKRGGGDSSWGLSHSKSAIVCQRSPPAAGRVLCPFECKHRRAKQPETADRPTVRPRD